MGMVLAAAMGVWFNQTQQPAPPPQPQLSTPDIGLPKGLFPPSDDQNPRRLAGLVRSEQRDDVWATAAEARLKARYASLVSAGRIKLLRLTCSRTVCEMVGTAPHANLKRLNATWRDLQDPKRNDLGVSATVKHASMIFGNDVFAAYWVRSG